jgi:hypothetical protein
LIGSFSIFITILNYLFFIVAQCATDIEAFEIGLIAPRIEK